jgi:hypothetical protein
MCRCRCAVQPIPASHGGCMLGSSLPLPCPPLCNPPSPGPRSHAHTLLAGALQAPLRLGRGPLCGSCCRSCTPCPCGVWQCQVCFVWCAHTRAPTHTRAHPHTDTHTHPGHCTGACPLRICVVDTAPTFDIPCTMSCVSRTSRVVGGVPSSCCVLHCLIVVPFPPSAPCSGGDSQLGVCKCCGPVVSSAERSVCISTTYCLVVLYALGCVHHSLDACTCPLVPRAAPAPCRRPGHCRGVLRVRWPLCGQLLVRPPLGACAVPVAASEYPRWQPQVLLTAANCHALPRPSIPPSPSDS